MELSHFVTAKPKRELELEAKLKNATKHIRKVWEKWKHSCYAKHTWREFDKALWQAILADIKQADRESNKI